MWSITHEWVSENHTVPWTGRAPRGRRIASAYVRHMFSFGLGGGRDWGGGFFWNGGSRGVRTFDGEGDWSSASTGWPRFRWPHAGTHYFGWRVSCRARRCRNGGHQWLSVEFLELRVHELRGPRLTGPDGLWRAKGWMRGHWRLHVLGHSESGLRRLWPALAEPRGL